MPSRPALASGKPSSYPTLPAHPRTQVREEGWRVLQQLTSLVRVHLYSIELKGQVSVRGCEGEAPGHEAQAPWVGARCVPLRFARGTWRRQRAPPGTAL